MIQTIREFMTLGDSLGTGRMYSGFESRANEARPAKSRARHFDSPQMALEADLASRDVAKIAIENINNRDYRGAKFVGSMMRLNAKRRLANTGSTESAQGGRRRWFDDPDQFKARITAR